MLLLLFHAGNDLYALDIAQVVEIIPRVNLRRVNHCPSYIAGLFNYRNSIVPVIDLCQLLHHQASRPYLSTRIIMVQAPSLQNRNHCLGLMAERVTETLKISDTTLSTSGTRLDQAPPYLDEMMMYEKRMIQRIRLEGILSLCQHHALTLAEPFSNPGAFFPTAATLQQDWALVENGSDSHTPHRHRTNGNGIYVPL